MGQIKHVLLELSEMALDFFEDKKFKKNNSSEEFKKSLFPKTYKDFLNSINKPIHPKLTIEESKKFAEKHEYMVMMMIKEFCK